MNRTICKTRELEESVLIKTREFKDDSNEVKFYDVPFNNYFFIEEDDREMAMYWLKNFVLEEEVFTDPKGKNYIKIIVNDNTKKYYIRSILDNKEIKHYEIDVPANKRILLDKFNDLKQENLKFTFIDIETYDLKPLEKNMMGMVEGVYPILCFAAKDLEEGKTIFHRNKGLDGDFFKEYRERYLDFINIRKKIDEINEKIFELQKKGEDIEDTEEITELKNKKEELMIDYNGLRNFLNSHEEMVLTKLFEGEKELLEEYAKYIKNYDVALAYNGWGFDFPYLRDRFERHQMNYDDLFIVDSDYMKIVETNTYGERENNSLQSVAESELSEEYAKYSVDNDLEENEKKPENMAEIEDVGKVDWKMITNAKKYFELFLLYPDIMKEYNIQDVNLLYMIEKKLSLLLIHITSTKECNCLFNDSIFNSKSLDNKFLIQFRKNNLVSPSSPSKDLMDARKDKFNGVFPGGGYTYVFKPGLHNHLICNDFKSFYPTTVITYDISPEAFVKSVKPDLNLIFNEEEIEFLNYAQISSKNHLDAQGKIKQKPYEKDLENYRSERGLPTLNELMFRFIENYYNKELLKECKNNNYTMTPGDINYDTRGWKIYPHYIFEKGKYGERNIFPQFVLHCIETRDKKKYEKKKHEPGTSEYESMDRFEKGIKKLSNSAYGFFVFKNCRYFMEEVANAITSSCRATMKKSVKFIENQGCEITHGDSITKDMKIHTQNEYKKVEDLWNECDSSIIKRGEKEIKIWNGENILSCDNEFNNKFLKPTEIIRHKVKKKIYKISLSSGDYLELTEDHGLIFLDENLKYTNESPKEVLNKKLKYVLFNKKIPNEKIISKNYSKEFYNLMGMIIANGNLDLKRNLIYLSFNYPQEYINEIIKPLSEEYKFSLPKIKKNGYDFRIYSKFLVQELYQLGFKGTSRDKLIPEWLYLESKENILSFLGGYFTGDGTIFERHLKNKTEFQIKCSSINYNLMIGMKILLQKCGIGVSFRDDKKKNYYLDKDTKTTMKELVVLNKMDFKNQIKLDCEFKQNRLNKITHSEHKVLYKDDLDYQRRKLNIRASHEEKTRYKSDFIMRRINKIEEINYEDYVYDFSIPETQKFYANDFLVHNTDSSYYKIGTNITPNQIDKKLFNFYNDLVKNYNCNANVEINNPYYIQELEGEKKLLYRDFEVNEEFFETKEEVENNYEKYLDFIERHNKIIENLKPYLKTKSDHFIVFEYEKTFDACIVVAKKRYYFKQAKGNYSFKYGSKGGAFVKTDTLKIAGKYQKELVRDILDNNFEKEVWYDKIKNLRESVFNNELDVEDLVKIKGLKRQIHDYGKPMIDKKTGEQKKTKDGKFRFAPIPAHVQVAKAMEENGEIVDLNDKIKYIVKERIGSSKKIVPISPMEYVRDKIYDSEYYWGNFESVFKEILEVTHPDLVDTYFEDCWNDFYKVKKKKKKKKKKR